MEDTAIWIQCKRSLRLKLEALARSEQRSFENQLISLIDAGLRVFESIATHAGGEQKNGQTVP